MDMPGRGGQLDQGLGLLPIVQVVYSLGTRKAGLRICERRPSIAKARRINRTARALRRAPLVPVGRRWRHHHLSL